MEQPTTSPWHIIGNQRLLVLADHLEALPPVEFNLATWVMERDVDTDSSLISESNDDHDVRKLTQECGYVACAVGHACGIAAFKEQGLSMRATKTWKDKWTWALFPVYTEGLVSCRGWEAVTRFFKISSDDAYHLFDEEEYIVWTGEDYSVKTEPTEVAARIRAFVAKREVKEVV